MRHAPLLLLLALGCSETPSVPAADAQVAADLCVCQDGTVPPDVALEDHPDVVDAGGPDVVDAPAPVDAPDVALVDAPELADVVVADAFDAAAPDVVDAGLDAAVVDAPDVQLADVVEDRPDVVDAARDAGPADAGPVVYDLNAARTSLSATLLWGLVCFSRDCSGDICDATVVPDQCFVASDGVHFTFSRCGAVTGLVRPGGAGTVGIMGTTTSQSSTTVTTAGARYVAGGAERQNFHVQFAAPATSGAAGARGIPGRTPSPALGSIWLFGCEVR